MWAVGWGVPVVKGGGGGGGREWVTETDANGNEMLECMVPTLTSTNL